MFLGDKLVGEVSRLVVAEACIQALDIDFTEGQTYEINSIPVTILSYYIYFHLQLSLINLSYIVIEQAGIIQSIYVKRYDK